MQGGGIFAVTTDAGGKQGGRVRLRGQPFGKYGEAEAAPEFRHGPDDVQAMLPRRQAPQKESKGLWWKMIGRNKKSVGMYLGDPDAAAIFLEMVKTADVVIESFRPGVIEKWGLGYDKLKQALIDRGYAR